MLGKIWGKSDKKVVDGHWYVKYNDVVKLLGTKKSIQENIDMNQIATYLNKKGWAYENYNGPIWKKINVNNKSK